MHALLPIKALQFIHKITNHTILGKFQSFNFLRSKKKKHLVTFLLRVMTTSKYIVLVFLAITYLSAVSWAGNVDYEEFVSAECGYTRYPTLCVQTLTQLGSHQKVDILFALVNKTIVETKMPDSYVGSLASSSISPYSTLIQTAGTYIHVIFTLHAVLLILIPFSCFSISLICRNMHIYLFNELSASCKCACVKGEKYHYNYESF